MPPTCADGIRLAGRFSLPIELVAPPKGSCCDCDEPTRRDSREDNVTQSSRSSLPELLPPPRTPTPRFLVVAWGGDGASSPTSSVPAPASLSELPDSTTCYLRHFWGRGELRILTLPPDCGGVATLLLPLLDVAPSNGCPLLRRMRRPVLGWAGLCFTALCPAELLPLIFRVMLWITSLIGQEPSRTSKT